MPDDERDYVKIFLGLALVFTLLYFGTNGFTNVPVLNIPIGGGDGVQPGTQTKSTVVFYNGTAAADGTIQLISFAGVPVASGSISAGTGTTGTVTPGLYLRYISGVTGAAAYVDTVNVSAVTDVAQTYVTLPPVQIYRNSSTYSMTMGAEGAAYTRQSTGSAGTMQNYSMSAQVASDFTLTLSEKQGYAQLFEEYEDPISKVDIEPILWVEVTSTNVYTTSSAIKSFEDTANNKTIFLLPISSLFNAGKQTKSATHTFSLTVPTAQSAVYTAKIVTYSDMTTLLNAETAVANAAGPFTVASWTITSGYFLVT
jgi:hypothetical protein